MDKRTLFALACVAVLTTIAVGQNRDDVERLLGSKADRSFGTTSTALFLSPPMEEPVSAEEYTVGPSDVFVVSFWTTPPAAYTLPVTPEGFLLVPTVGEVPVAGASLSEARRAVLAAIRTKYLNAGAGLTLVQAREVRVTIEGAVRRPGVHAIFASERIARAIAIANEPSPANAVGLATRPADVTQIRAEDLDVESDPTTKASSRNVLLIRRSGDRKRIDLNLASIRRDGSSHPYLQEGDRVIVPRRSPSAAMISIAGGVYAPGRFEFVEGDHVRLLFELGRGAMPMARLDSVVLMRSDETDRHEVLDLRDSSAAWQRPLRPGDRLIVPLAVPEGSLATVEVDGEVRTPGRYPIFSGVTRVSEVVALAGGLLPTASPSSSYIVRTGIPVEVAEREKLLSRRGEDFPEGRRLMEVENEIRVRFELVSVNLDALMRKGDASQDAVLMDNDRIVISRTTGSIYVYGQVVRPGHVPFRTGASVAEYLEWAGGLTEDARTSGIMVVKRSTRQWLSTDATIIEDGDAIWVPLDPDRPWTYYLGQLGQIASVLSVTLTLVLLLSK